MVILPDRPCSLDRTCREMTEVQNFLDDVRAFLWWVWTGPARSREEPPRRRGLSRGQRYVACGLLTRGVAGQARRDARRAWPDSGYICRLWLARKGTATQGGRRAHYLGAPLAREGLVPA